MVAMYNLQLFTFCMGDNEIWQILSDWIGLCSVLRPRQHSIGYMGDGFYRSKDPTNSIKVLKE